MTKWINNTIFISRIQDAGPIYSLVKDLIDMIRGKNRHFKCLKNNIDLEFLHTTVCYADREFQLVLHILSSESIINEVSTFIAKSYDKLYVKCVEVNAHEDVVNLVVHEKGQLQSEKTVPKGLSKHLVDELEKVPMQGKCFSFTVPEMFHAGEKDFIERLADLKYNKNIEVIPNRDDDLAF